VAAESPAGTRRPRLRIDPRIRQRRIQVKREEGRRRLRILVATLGSLGAVLVAAVALHSPLLAARHVAVVGATHTPAAEIREAAGLAHAPPLIDIGGGRAARAVDRLPWIATAHVTRAWPDGARISVTERTPVAVVAGALVDVTGRVLGPSSPALPLPTLIIEPPAPPLALPPAGGTAPAAYRPGLAVAAALPPALVPRVTAVAVEPDGSVDLHLTGGASAVLGDASQLPQKLAAVLTLAARVDIGAGVINVTVPGAPVLRS
jgi:cell division protein FtsQ